MLEHEWSEHGILYRFRWLGNVDVTVARVYALAFTAAGEMLLVGNDAYAPKAWLPGGGVEGEETELETLQREFVEEANAQVLQAERIGVQACEAVENGRSTHTHQAFYWCRIALLDGFAPEHEVTIRYFVSPEQFLDTLFWGRSDPKATLLLEKALALQGEYSSR